jgi:hypothetical protein
MNENIEYKVVYQLGYLRLQDEVNKLILDGWIPLGGISVFTYPDKDKNGVNVYTIGCAQSMVKKLTL